MLAQTMHHFFCKNSLSRNGVALGLFAILVFSAIAFAEEPETKAPFYKNISANIEMRLVIESDDKETPWLYIQDLKGTPHKVSEEILIDSSDVEGATFTGTNEFGDELLKLYFHEKFWMNIFEKTARVKGKKLAIIIEGEIFSTPIIFEPIFRAAQITGDTMSLFDQLLKGFVLATRPSHLDSESSYKNFLSKWVSSHPNDLEMKEKLAYSYIKDKQQPEYELAIPFFEELVKAKPQKEHLHTELVESYVYTSQFDQALVAAKNALTKLSASEQTFMYGYIAEIYIIKGKKDQALKNFQIHLEKVQNMDVPYFRMVEGTNHYVKVEGQQDPKKAALIQQIKSRIEYIQSH